MPRLIGTIIAFFIILIVSAAIFVQQWLSTYLHLSPILLALLSMILGSIVIGIICILCGIGAALSEFFSQRFPARFPPKKATEKIDTH